MNIWIDPRPVTRLRWRVALPLGLAAVALLVAGLGWLDRPPPAPGVRVAWRATDAAPAVHAAGAPLPPDGRTVAAAPSTPAAASFEAQLLAVVYGAPGPQALWQLFQAGRHSTQPEQRYLAYQALRACAASVPPYSALPAPMAARPVWMTNESILLADRARADLLARCTPFSSIGRSDWQRHERELQTALETRPWPADAAAEPHAQALDLAHDRLQDFFARYGAAALAWAGSDLVDYIEGLHGLQAASTAGRATAPPLARLTQGATDLALCELGAACGPDSTAALLVCYSTGNCTGSLQDRLLRAYATQAERDAAMAQARELADALRSGDLSRYGL